MTTHPRIDTAPIASCIIVVRGVRVLLDRDLADLYRVRAIALRQQVKRNRARFPADFMFQLTPREVAGLLSQSGEGSGFSVDGVPITDDVRSEADQGSCPQQDGLGVRAGTTAT